jgi:uncharacterized protein (UPF0264 family)
MGVFLFTSGKLGADIVGVRAACRIGDARCGLAESQDHRLDTSSAGRVNWV